jgi:hypothetical protein
MKALTLNPKQAVLLRRLIETLLDLSPVISPGSPVNAIQTAGSADRICGCCLSTWDSTNPIDHENHFDYCPVFIADKLDRSIDDTF